MKGVAEFAFLAYGLAWFLLVQAICVKHFNQGTHRMVRDMHSEMMSDTIHGPRIGQPRAWEPHERFERQLLVWSTRVMLVMTVALYLILQFGR